MTPLSILTAILNTLWQGAALAVLVWLVLRWVRINAATRCVIWWAVLAMLVVLPIAPRFAMPQHVLALTSARGQIAPVSYSLPPDVDEAPAMMTLQETPAARWPVVIFALWAIVLLYKLAGIGQSYLHLRRVKRNSTLSNLPLPEVGRRARLLISRDIASPMAVGFLRPAVILPEGLTERITRGELDQILLHEAAHLARWDDWSNLLGRLLGAVLALHPVAWWILRQIEYEREAACDDWVVARTGAARPYAEALAHMVELRWQGRDSRQTEALASGVFGRGSRIADRIEMLLQRGREFQPRVSFRRVAGGVFALCCLAAAGSFAPRWIAFAAPKKLVFEAASIRPHDAPLHTIRGFSSSGPRLTLEGYNLMQFVLEAYNLKNYQVSMGASVAQQDIYYDVVAKAEGDGAPTKDEFRQMLQALLAERFNFRFHREKKEMPVYALVVGKNGPKFKESPLDGPDAPAANNRGVNGRNQNVVLSQGSMASVADFIWNGLGSDRPVLDKTELTGKYTLKLEATPEFRINNNPQPEDISVFDAVQSQLGLKLESQKADIDVLVVDHIEKPSEN